MGTEKRNVDFRSKQATQQTKGSCSRCWTENERYTPAVKRKRSLRNSRFSLLFAAEDVSRGITSATQRQKFHADDVRSVRNPVRSADWSTEYLHCFSDCLRITDKREKATRVKCQRDESLTLQSKLVDDILLFRKIYREKHKIEQIWMWNPMTTGCIL